MHLTELPHILHRSAPPGRWYTRFLPSQDHGQQPLAVAALAGTVAAAAYAAEMYVDKAVTGSDFDDIQLVESAIRGRMARVPVLGMSIHLANGAALAVIYDQLVRPRLRGPAWVRGLTFGLMFLAAVWPLTPLVDRLHPLIRRGEMPRLARPTPFAQNVARHLVFGLVVGLVCPGRKPR